MNAWFIVVASVTTIAMAAHDIPKKNSNKNVSVAFTNQDIPKKNSYRNVSVAYTNHTTKAVHHASTDGIPISLPLDFKLTTHRRRSDNKHGKLRSMKIPLKDFISRKRAQAVNKKTPSSRGNIDTLEKAAAVPQDVPAMLLSLAGNKQVQAAAVEKGLEVAGKMIDKTLENIDEAQENVKKFLKEKFKVNIVPGKGWESEDMFAPPAYHIDAEVDEGEEKSDQASAVPYHYPAGVGNVLMNGCFGTGYEDGDPCFDAVKAGKQTACTNMIDGAAFIGVGLDGRGEYGEESRKMSIIQRDCAGSSSYEGFQVPDTMNVYGIYDTYATMFVFEHRSEYQQYLEKQAAVSGSFLTFNAGVKSAFGSSQTGASQSFLSIFDVDIFRYEIFKDEVKPNDLSRAFLREFMRLPPAYYSPGAAASYQNFILRWGTHYIKSGKFGGQLEFRKVVQGTQATSKVEVQHEMEAHYNALFWSAGASSSAKASAAKKTETKYTSSSLRAHGGSQEIASILSDTYSPTFKQEFKSWLNTIPDYPKAIKFTMGSITDLVNFRADDLFPDEEITWGCDGHSTSLLVEAGTDKKYYEVTGEAGATKKYYCEFTNRNDLNTQILRRRNGLERAIEVYMEEGPISISDISLPAGTFGCQTDRFGVTDATSAVPTWSEVTHGAELIYA